MTRLICSILAAGSTAFSMAAPASAHEDRAPIARRADYEGGRYRHEGWRELQRERQRFCQVRHTRAECARFERWYSQRCDQLRYR
jgi:Ni/Co efflux regulator RcnB